MFSTIFYGPPGTGKTTLIQCLVNDMHLPSMVFNASIDNKEKLQQILAMARLEERFVIIIEEIHRLNKDKQDLLLSLLETNKIFILAATTENPYFSINPAVRSRCQILTLQPVEPKELQAGLKHLIERHQLAINIDDAGLNKIATHCHGDLRGALNILDLLINLYPHATIDDHLLYQVMQTPMVLGAHYGDELHNLKSAFHKSLRGSDVDASLHYLARLIKLGALDEIARRMLACVYEDVGLANVNLCLRVSMGIETCYRLGFPECHQVLGNLAVQIALSPKSNSTYVAINDALADCENGPSYNIPQHLWDDNYASAHKLGVEGYFIHMLMSHNPIYLLR